MKTAVYPSCKAVLFWLLGMLGYTSIPFQLRPIKENLVMQQKEKY